MAKVAVVPISETDLDQIGGFLHSNLNDRISPAEWARAPRAPWRVHAPNHGFMLKDGDAIAGAYLAYYSTREIEGRVEQFCNLAAWCVLPGYRLHSLKLLKAMLAQPGYHFTDLSPSGNAIAVNERLRFTRLDTTTALMVNVPWLSLARRWRITSKPEDIESSLSGSELGIYRDHRDARASNHLLLTQGGEICHIIFRRDRRKGLPLFASILYVSNRAVFARCARALGAYLLVRQRIPFTLLELRTVGSRPAGSILLAASRPKMFRSDTLRPEHVDNLYSELACLAW